MTTPKETLVLGASLKPYRYSHIAVKRLVANHIATQAFGLKDGEISGIQIKTNLNDFQNIDTVTLYINVERQSEYYKAILKMNPKRVIFNPGTENPEFYKLLAARGIEVEVACTLVLLATHQY